jgi:hypothetical protein
VLASKVVDLVLEARWMAEGAEVGARLMVSLLPILLLGQLLEPQGSKVVGEC